MEELQATGTFLRSIHWPERQERFKPRPKERRRRRWSQPREAADILEKGALRPIRFGIRRKKRTEVFFGKGREKSEKKGEKKGKQIYLKTHESP
jgi:hypothetical protein